MKTVTTLDIAKKLNLSVATVSRAFTGSAHISTQTKELVLKTAAEMGYRVNKAAQALRSGPLCIGVLLCCPVKNYADEIMRGIREAMDGLVPLNISYETKFISGNAAEHEKEVLDVLSHYEKTNVDGLILFLSGNCKIFEEKLQSISQVIPIAFVGNDPGFARVIRVMPDGVCAGNLAMELLGLCHKKPRVAILTGSNTTDIHLAYVMGAQWFASSNGYPPPTVFEHFDDPAVLEEILGRISKEGGFDGIYITSSVTVPSEKMAKNLSDKGISIVATDLSVTNYNLLKKHLFQAVVFQDPHYQGVSVVNGLHAYLTQKVANSLYVKPHLLFSSDAENHHKQ